MQEIKEYTYPELSKAVQQTHTDVTIHCGEVEFNAHWAIITAGSPFFKELLVNSKEIPKDITLNSVDPLSMVYMMGYFYTGQLFSPDTVEGLENLLKAALFLRVGDFHLKLHQLYNNIIKKENILDLWKVASNLHNVMAKDYMMHFVSLNLNKLYRSKVFLRLPFEFMDNLLTSKYMPKINVELLADALLIWLYHDAVQREKVAEHLLIEANLERLDSKMVVRFLKDHPVLNRSVPIRTAMLNALKDSSVCEVHTVDELVVTPNKEASKEPTTDSPENAPTSPRKTRERSQQSERPGHSHSKTVVLVTTPHCSTDRNSKLTANPVIPTEKETVGKDLAPSYKSFSDTTFRIFEQNEPLNMAQLSRICDRALNSYEFDIFDGNPKLDPVVFLIGYHKEVMPRSTVLCYNLSSCQWENPKNLDCVLKGNFFPIPEDGLGLVSGNWLYIIGGKMKTGEMIADVHILDVLKHRLLHGSPMHEARSNMGGCILDDGCMYVAGGLTGNRQGTTIFERYHPWRDKWEKLDPLPQSLWDMAMAGIDKKLYILGGRAKNDWNRNCYVYDVLLNQWSKLTELPMQYEKKTVLLGTAVKNNKIMIFSRGASNTPCLKRCCIFDPKQLTWTMTKATNTHPVRPVAVLTWENKVWVVDSTSKVHIYNPTIEGWDQILQFRKAMACPLYAVILHRPRDECFHSGL